MGNILGDLIHAPRGRLTLETGVAISTSDQTAKTTIYFTPFRGNAVPLYDTTHGVWTILEFSETSMSLSGFTASKNSDVFVYNNAGTLALERVEWTNDTTRATAITLQDGRYVKSGDESRLYVGTFRTTGTTGQCEDSADFRGVWNYYNRVLRRLYKSDTTNHTYGTGTWRSWNNDATLRVELVIGVAEEPTDIAITGKNHGVTDGVVSAVGVGYDVTNAAVDIAATFQNDNLQYTRASGRYFHQIGLGYHFYQAIEIAGTGSNVFDQVYLNVGMYG